MGSNILKGMTAALLVTVLTLFGGMAWSALGFSEVNFTWLVDIGLLLSCVVGGYRAARESGEWMLGGAAGAGFVIVGTLLLALFLPIRVWGFIQVLGEGLLIGLIAGAFAVGSKGNVRNAWPGGHRKTSYYKPYYQSYGSENEDNNDPISEKKVNDENNVTEWPWDTEDRRKPSQEAWRSDSWQAEPVYPQSGYTEPKFLESRELEPYKVDEWEFAKNEVVRQGKASHWDEEAGKGRPWWE